MAKEAEAGLAGHSEALGGIEMVTEFIHNIYRNERNSFLNFASRILNFGGMGILFVSVYIFLPSGDSAFYFLFFSQFLLSSYFFRYGLDLLLFRKAVVDQKSLLRKEWQNFIVLILCNALILVPIVLLFFDEYLLFQLSAATGIMATLAVMTHSFVLCLFEELRGLGRYIDCIKFNLGYCYIFFGLLVVFGVKLQWLLLIHISAFLGIGVVLILFGLLRARIRRPNRDCWVMYRRNLWVFLANLGQITFDNLPIILVSRFAVSEVSQFGLLSKAILGFNILLASIFQANAAGFKDSPRNNTFKKVSRISYPSFLLFSIGLVFLVYLSNLVLPSELNLETGITLGLLAVVVPKVGFGPVGFFLLIKGKYQTMALITVCALATMVCLPLILPSNGGVFVVIIGMIGFNFVYGLLGRISDG